MFSNYIKIAWRNLRKHRLFTLVNLSGLAIGLAAYLLITQFVVFERSYDAKYDNSDNMYRLSTLSVVNGNVDTKDAMSFYPVGKKIASEIPEVVMTTTTLKMDELVLRKGGSVVYETGAVSADSNFLKLFTYDVLHGDSETMLDEPFSIVLTEQKALDYFGRSNVVGETLELLGDYNRPFEVTGVIENIQANTHYKFDLLLSDGTLKDRFDYGDDWNSFNYYTYFTLQAGTDLDLFAQKLDDIADAQFPEESTIRFTFDPVTAVHLTSDYTFEAEPPGSASGVRFMFIISFFIIGIAWVNYINLSTARAIDRAREVGLRKVVGAMRGQLVGQFLFESFLMNTLAAILAMTIAEIALPFFNQLVGLEIIDHVWQMSFLPFTVVAFIALGTFLAGAYPAFVLSSYRPAATLKGRYKSTTSGAAMRKGLVVVQFAASIVLIASTFTVYKQLSYMLNRDLGMNTDYVVAFRMPAQQEGDQRDIQTTQWNTFKDRLRSSPAIETVGGTSNLPGGGSSDINSTNAGVRIVDMTDWKAGTVYVQYNDDEFLDAVDLDLIAGRDFDRNRKADTMVVMVNQAMLNRLGIYNEEDALDQYFQFKWNEEGEKYQIIGIIEDFNRTTLKKSVEPTVYMPWMDPGAAIVELSEGNYRDGLAHLETTWASFFPNTPLDYIFLDDRFERLYEQDKRFGTVFTVFSILAVMIASLGLFGLSAFMAVQRTKEVGVRKVLGATTTGIIGLFYKDFAILIGISSILGIPAVYYFISNWLENYAFRIDFPWIVLLYALVIVLCTALLVVAYQVRRVAVLNPAETLNYE